MVFYGLMAYFAIRDASSTAARMIIAITFPIIVVLVGFSRIYLGVHYPSDVLGGYSAGLMWLAIITSDVELLRYWQLRMRRRAKRLSDSTPLPARDSASNS